jgi:hypothetical protein
MAAVTMLRYRLLLSSEDISMDWLVMTMHSFVVSVFAAARMEFQTGIAPR